MTLLISELNRLSAEKLLRSNVHPTLPLTIYNYTEITQYRKKWNPTLLQCRGLVVDYMGTVVAKPFPKFFNLGDTMAEQAIPPVPTITNYCSANYRIYNKLDGSLGVFFCYKGEWIMSSRGSFNSEQARVGTELAQKAQLANTCDPAYTYVFEIIYPSNRIVIDYQDKKELVLLGVVKTSALDCLYEELNDEELAATAEKLSVPLAKDCTEDLDLQDKTFDDIRSLNIENEEGYVVRFENGSRLKIKFPDYVALHSVRTGFQTSMLLEWLVENRSVESCLDMIPDELHEQVTAVETLLETQLQKKMESLKKDIDYYVSQNMTFKSIVAQCEEKGLTSVQYGIICKYVKLSRESGNSIMNETQIRRDCALALAKEKQILDLVETQVPTSSTWKNRSKFSVPDVCYTPRITVMVGISGSGKTFTSRRYVRFHKGKTVRISRDDLRDQFGERGSRLSNEQENYITKIFDMLVDKALSEGLNVIMDNTHLKIEYIDRIKKKFANSYPIRFQLLNPPLDTCIERVKSRESRESQVSEKLVKQQYTALQHLLSIDNALQECNPIQAISCSTSNANLIGNNRKRKLTYPSPSRKFNPVLPFVFVFDVDGTLALMQNRNPFDESQVLNDVSNPDVVALHHALAADDGSNIIICSGRTEQCRPDTLTWLDDRGIHPKRLYLRQIGDNRPDYIIKQEMWKDISKDFNIRLMVDDRNGVVKAGRDAGYTVLQVADGDF